MLHVSVFAGAAAMTDTSAKHLRAVNETSAKRYQAAAGQATDGTASQPTCRAAHAPDPLFTEPSLSRASSYLTQGLTVRSLKLQGQFLTITQRHR